MTRWLVTGAGGMLGQDLTALLRASDADVIALARAELDVTDEAAVAAAVREVRPDVVANCAAWTAVDDAESHEAEAMAVNGQGAAHLAAACAKAGAQLVQMSTDYVFGGTGTQPYPEDYPAAPRSAYGRTKLAGERAARELLPDASYVVRTAWLYGAHGPNFVRTMIRLEASRDTIDVVNDQQGQPTWTCDVARQIMQLVQAAARPGVYHVSSTGWTTWMGLARAVFALLDADPCRVLPTSTSELGRPAPRPAYSVLSHAKWASAGLAPLPDWECSLRQAFPSIASAAGREPVGHPTA
ncbi:MAG TPA: dTDP-4-dehydrorhamnose reductase [Streptosporangiaceae bacterium]|nr:dTDP-4-dehydrorhamnose reductase [Streptosporangiaceae bacterium]